MEIHVHSTLAIVNVCLVYMGQHKSRDSLLSTFTLQGQTALTVITVTKKSGPLKYIKSYI